MRKDDTAAATQSSYRSSLKSMDTEEGIDLVFYRRIGYMWAVLARRLGITPNTITIASIFLGIAAGVCMYYNIYLVNLVGIGLLVLANSFDSADGQLARMTHSYSRLGRILDGISGDLWFITIYIAICLRENVTSAFFMQHHWLIWVVAALTGICHAKQAAMADYYRQFHLYFLKGSEGSELERAFTLKRKLAAMDWHKDFWSKLFLSFYTNYTVQQEATTPAMQRLRSRLSDRYGDGAVPIDFRDDFRSRSLPLMKYTNILSFNWRTIALFISLLIKMPWLYFAFELTVLNFILVMMVVRHERICARLTQRLNDGYYDGKD